MYELKNSYTDAHSCVSCLHGVYLGDFARVYLRGSLEGVRPYGLLRARLAFTVETERFRRVKRLLSDVVLQPKTRFISDGLG